MNVVKRLGYDFKPDNYVIKLQPDINKMSFTGSVIITGYKCGKPSKRLTFHQKGLKIKDTKITRIDNKKGAINIDVERINTIKTSNELRVHSNEVLYPGKFIVEIFFSGQINEKMHGMYTCNFMHEGTPAKLVTTQLESHYAREVFPCIDEPSAKATFDLTLVTSKNVTVLSNTTIKKQSKDKFLTTTFETTPIMSTYLLAFAYGAFVKKEGISSGGVKVGCYATPEHIELLDFSLSIATKAIDFFEKYFGVKYPLPKLDMVALPDFSAGAMENWGLITYRESCMLVDKNMSSLDTKQFAALIICHEIAHQWFGNLVTMEWWDDLWLNESFANLMEYRAVDELFPEWNIWEHFVNNELNSATRRDCLPNVQPVKLEVRHPEEINTLFDPSIVYAKGSVLLKMLIYKIGEDNFRKGLKKYFLKHSYKNTSGDDLWSSLSDASGQELNKFMMHWLTTPGLPVVELNYTPGSSKAEANQSRLIIGKTTNYNTNWPVPLAASVRIVPDHLNLKNEMISISGVAQSVFLLNNEANSYFVCRYSNGDHFKLILNNVSKLSTINKMLLVQNYSLLERAGITLTINNLELIAAFRGEKNESVLTSMLGIFSSARRLVFRTKAENAMKSFIVSLARPLIEYTGWNESIDDTVQMKKLRELVLTLGASAEIPEIINQGLVRFHKSHNIFDIRPDIRSTVLYIAGRYGSNDDFQRLVFLYKNSLSAEEKEEICQALTATKDREHISELIALMNSSHIRLQDLSAWFARLIANPYAKDQTWDWMTRNWQWLKKQYGGDRSRDRYPQYAAAGLSHQDELEKYVRFFKPMMDDIALSRIIQLGIEEINGKVAWRKKNESKAIEWLLNSDSNSISQ